VEELCFVCTCMHGCKDIYLCAGAAVMFLV
jgi:hypothetical protein